jgi:hypothetical protein
MEVRDHLPASTYGQDANAEVTRRAKKSRRGPNTPECLDHAGVLVNGSPGREPGCPSPSLPTIPKRVSVTADLTSQGLPDGPILRRGTGKFNESLERVRPARDYRRHFVPRVFAGHQSEEFAAAALARRRQKLLGGVGVAALHITQNASHVGHIGPGYPHWRSHSSMRTTDQTRTRQIWSKSEFLTDINPLRQIGTGITSAPWLGGLAHLPGIPKGEPDRDRFLN